MKTNPIYWLALLWSNPLGRIALILMIIGVGGWILYRFGTGEGTHADEEESE
ncbi:MAG: hypothetical protein WCW14_01795 [Candidatus Paceibacterota bacterium]